MARKGFSKGPQNFEARIDKAEARIVSITEQAQDAEQVIATAKDRKAELRATLASLTQAIAKGEEVTEETVSSALFA
jgi:chromosome segregation ATPase